MSPVTVEELNEFCSRNTSFPVDAIKPSTRRRIYFVQAATGEVKIGVTTSAKIRNKLRSIQTYCPSKIRLLLVVEERNIMPEHEIHKKFANIRIRGEWFSPSPELLDWIKKFKK